MPRDTSFMTFLAAIRSWLAAARDEEVADLYEMVKAERARRKDAEKPGSMPPPAPPGSPAEGGEERKRHSS